MSCGLYNRGEFKPSMLVQDGYYDDSWHTGERIARWKWSPFRMSMECEFQKDDKYQLPDCIGCSRKSTKGEIK